MNPESSRLAPQAGLAMIIAVQTFGQAQHPYNRKQFLS